MEQEELAKYFDHTILKPTAMPEDVKKICEEAKKYNFASVCINPCYVELAVKKLSGSDVMTCTVIGFPLGAETTESKASAAKKAVETGADEIDMVINIGMLKSGDFEYVKNDINSVVKASKGKTVKVIIETCYLTDEEKIRACKLSKTAGARFVKTSTGFGSGGATKEDIALMRKISGSDMKVKASGGIRDLKTALDMIEAGADRIGASASVSILKELKN
jgi:deoxyribose-phosphate aldolase